MSLVSYLATDETITRGETLKFIFKTSEVQQSYYFDRNK